MDVPEIASMIFSRKVPPEMASSTFGFPIRSDLPAARTIADINVYHHTSCAFTGGPKYRSLRV
jgi:hypothetical protein